MASIAAQAAAAAGFVGGSGVQLAASNRAQWGHDTIVAQTRRFHMQGLLLSQAHIFREDLQNLVKCANNELHNLILVSTLLLGYCKTLVGSLPPAGTRSFLADIAQLASGTAFLYLLLAVVCSLCALSMSQKFERDMLINALRLPVHEVIGENEETEGDITIAAFERQSLATILRLPGWNRLTGTNPSHVDHILHPRRTQAQTGTAAQSSRNASEFLTRDALRARGEKFRKEFTANEAQWDSLCRIAPCFVFWGLQNMLCAIAYRSFFADPNYMSNVGLEFWLLVPVLFVLAAVQHVYVRKVFAVLSPFWMGADAVLLFSIAVLNPAIFRKGNNCGFGVFNRVCDLSAQSEDAAVITLFAVFFTRHVLLATEFGVALYHHDVTTTQSQDAGSRLRYHATCDSLDFDDAAPDGSQVYVTSRVNVNKAIKLGIASVLCIVGAVWFGQLFDSVRVRAQKGPGHISSDQVGGRAEEGGPTSNVTAVSGARSDSRMLRGLAEPASTLAAAGEAADHVAPAYKPSAWQAAHAVENAPGQEVLATMHRMAASQQSLTEQLEAERRQSASQLRAMQEQMRLMAELQNQLLTRVPDL